MPRFPGISPTTATLSSKVFSDLTRRAQELGRPVHPLHVGDTYRSPPESAQCHLQSEAATPGIHRYAPVAGISVLRDAVQERLRQRTGQAPPDDALQIMSGGTAGLSVLAQTLLQPGDEVLLPSPYWPLIRGIIAARGAVPVEIPLFTELGKPGFDIERALASAVTDRTVALYLNSPHNPTGAVLPSTELNAIAALCAKHDLWVWSDEAYEELWFTESRPEPIWNHPALRERAIAIHTLSKSYGFAGARIGFCHGPNAVMDAVRSVQTYTTYCAATPMQHAAAEALRHGDDWLAEARAEYMTAGKKVAHALKVGSPAGGTFLFFDATPYLRNGETTHDFLIRCLEAGVLMTPGAASGKHYGNWVRICFTSVDSKALDDALVKLSPVLAGVPLQAM